MNGDEIVSTPTHPFYSPQRGWTSAVDLRAGDILVLSNGEYVIVEQVQHEILEAPVKVYNFEVQDFHTYYVGKNSVLVHNRCKLTDQEIDEYAKKYASAVNSNQAWSWKELSDGNKFSRRQKSLIRNRALESKLIPTVEMKPGTNTPDFASAGLVLKTGKLPETMWLLGDKAQFAYLDKKYFNGSRPAGTTWHHSDIKGQMELVPFGVHNIISHSGGRAKGGWAYAKR